MTRVIATVTLMQETPSTNLRRAGQARAENAVTKQVRKDFVKQCTQNIDTLRRGASRDSHNTEDRFATTLELGSYWTFFFD